MGGTDRGTPLSVAMTTIELRALARSYRLRAMTAARPVDRSLLMKMSEEFERDAKIAECEERLATRREPSIDLAA